MENLSGRYKTINKVLFLEMTIMNSIKKSKIIGWFNLEKNDSIDTRQQQMRKELCVLQCMVPWCYDIHPYSAVLDSYN